MISGIGGTGTILLALATFLTLHDNHILVKERMKEREKPLQRDLLEKIVWPAIDTIAENKEKLSDREINWTDADPEGDFDFVNINLDLIGERGDPVTGERFAEEYPEAVQSMVKYDQILAKLDSAILDFVQSTRGPLSDYIHSEGLDGGRPDPVFGSRTEDYPDVNLNRVYHLIFSGEDPVLQGEQPEWWENHKEDIYQIISENAEEDYRRVRNLRTNLFNYSNEVRDVLVGVREEIETEYGIPRGPNE